jgi:hypothetical protein
VISPMRFAIWHIAFKLYVIGLIMILVWKN